MNLTLIGAKRQREMKCVSLCCRESCIEAINYQANQTCRSSQISISAKICFPDTLLCFLLQAQGHIPRRETSVKKAREHEQCVKALLPSLPSVLKALTVLSLPINK